MISLTTALGKTFIGIFHAKEFTQNTDKKIPLEDRKKIKKAVLEAHTHGEIGGYGGKMSHYISVKDSDYDVLRSVVELLKKKNKFV